jgi:alpha-D-xyloside xylohydrolase
VVRQADGSVILYAPHISYNSRSATIGGPVSTIRLSSPLDGVIRVQRQHFSGGKVQGPDFALNIQPGQIVSEVLEDEETVALVSGRMKAVVRKQGPLRLEFFDGDRRLTASEPKAMAYVRDADGSVYSRDQLSLAVGEVVYGLGERFTAFVKNGQAVDSWNEDGGTNSEQSYKNVPFYLTNRGYGVLVNHPERVSFEVGSEKVSTVQFSVAGESLDFMVFNGPSLKQVLGRYTRLTGRPGLPPAWSFGLWLTTSFTTDYDEKTAARFIDGMAERSIALRVFHFDCFWMKEYEWCNFEWDEAA